MSRFHLNGSWAFVAAAFLAPSPGVAQHAQDLSDLLALEYSGCGFCHGSHATDRGTGAAMGGYALRQDRLPGIWGTTRGVTPEPGPASRSCLRCHMSPDLRLRQPEFEDAGGGAIPGGEYLRADFSDDHPIGRIDVGRRALVEDSFLDPAFRRSLSPMESLDPFGDHQLECTSCHDPHDRGGSTPGPEKQRVLCARCHESALHGRDAHVASVGCSACHGMHGGSDLSLLAEPDPNALCASCHGGWSGPTGTGERQELARQGPQGHLEPPVGRCITCHPIH